MTSHQVCCTAKRINQGGRVAGELECHGVNREVTTRQVNIDFVRVDHFWFARVRRVRLSPMRCDLIDPFANLQANRPEALPLRPDSISDIGHDALDFIGARRCCGVKVHLLGIQSSFGSPHQQVTHSATHQVQAMSGVAKTRSQRGHFLKNGGETWWDHGGSCCHIYKRYEQRPPKARHGTA